MIKLRDFQLDQVLLKLYRGLSEIEKIAFVSAFLIGFTTHLVIYTNRLFGNHDIGMVWRNYATVQTGRWLNNFITSINDGYILPLLVGLWISLFLALSALYICKILNIRKKLSAFFIGSLLTTFPSVAWTNLFIHDSANYHFGVLLAVMMNLLRMI